MSKIIKFETSKTISFEEFKKYNLKIEYLIECSSYGHHPYPLLAQKGCNAEFDELFFISMEEIYKILKRYIDESYDEIMISIDCPASKDIKNTFIMALHISNKKLLDIFIIEYNTQNGDIIKKSNGSNYIFVKLFKEEIENLTGVIL